jgi:hypothetical protein
MRHIAKERRMKTAVDQADFEAFAAVHQRAVWGEVLLPECKRREQPDWRPSSFMEGLAFQSQVNKVIREQFKIARATTKRER